MMFSSVSSNLQAAAIKRRDCQQLPCNRFYDHEWHGRMACGSKIHLHAFDQTDTFAADMICISATLSQTLTNADCLTLMQS